MSPLRNKYKAQISNLFNSRVIFSIALDAWLMNATRTAQIAPKIAQKPVGLASNFKLG